MKAITPLLMLFLCTMFSTELIAAPATGPVLLTISRGANIQETAAFVQQLEKYGIQLDKKVFHRSRGVIKKFNLGLAHADGLDWSIKAKGFTVFEMQLMLDEEGKLTHLAYRFNREGDFSKPLQMVGCEDSDGHSKHKHSSRTTFSYQ